MALDCLSSWNTFLFNSALCFWLLLWLFWYYWCPPDCKPLSSRWYRLKDNIHQDLSPTTEGLYVSKGVTVWPLTACDANLSHSQNSFWAFYALRFWNHCDESAMPLPSPTQPWSSSRSGIFVLVNDLTLFFYQGLASLGRGLCTDQRPKIKFPHFNHQTMTVWSLTSNDHDILQKCESQEKQHVL